MNRNLTFGIAALVALTMVITTGATPFAPFGTDEIQDADLSIQPSDGPNGVFAVLNEDEEIELLLTADNPHTDIEGVKDETVTTLDNVFTVTYTGKGYSRVWISDDIDAVHFYNGTTPSDRIDSRETGVVLAPNESVRVGLFVNTKGDNDVASIDDFTVHAETANTITEEESTATDTPPSTSPTAETPSPMESEPSSDGNSSIPTTEETGPDGAAPPERTGPAEDAATQTEDGGTGLKYAGKIAGFGLLVILVLGLATLGLVRQYR